jgi:hypothetical protein
VRASKAAVWLGGSLLAVPALAQVPGSGGPYNARLLPGGIGIERSLERADALVAAGSPYSIAAWVNPDARQAGEAALVTVGGCCATGRLRCAGR